MAAAIPAGTRNAEAFYRQGGYAYEKMDMPSKMAMKMFAKALKARKNQSDEEKLMAEMVSRSYDITDRKYTEPIVEYTLK